MKLDFLNFLSCLKTASLFIVFFIKFAFLAQRAGGLLSRRNNGLGRGFRLGPLRTPQDASGRIRTFQDASIRYVADLSRSTEVFYRSFSLTTFRSQRAQRCHYNNLVPDNLPVPASAQVLLQLTRPRQLSGPSEFNRTLKCDCDDLAPPVPQLQLRLSGPTGRSSALRRSGPSGRSSAITTIWSHRTLECTTTIWSFRIQRGPSAPPSATIVFCNTLIAEVPRQRHPQQSLHFVMECLLRSHGLHMRQGTPADLSCKTNPTVRSEGRTACHHSR